MRIRLQIGTPGAGGWGLSRGLWSVGNAGPPSPCALSLRALSLEALYCATQEGDSLPFGASALACDVGASPALVLSSGHRPGPEPPALQEPVPPAQSPQGRWPLSPGPVVLACGVENELVPVRGRPRRRSILGREES